MFTKQGRNTDFILMYIRNTFPLKSYEQLQNNENKLKNDILNLKSYW